MEQILLSGGKGKGVWREASWKGKKKSLPQKKDPLPTEGRKTIKRGEEGEKGGPVSTEKSGQVAVT